MKVHELFYTGWRCENGHITVPYASLYEVDLERETYSWIGGSQWDMCDHCPDGPIERQREKMRDDITRQVITRYWPGVAKEYRAQAKAAREERVFSGHD